MTAPRPGPRRDAVASLLPGLALAVAVAAVATVLGRAVPVVGAPVLGVVGGLAVSGWVRRRPALAPGLAFCARTVLHVAVVVLGAQLSLGQVADLGLRSLPVTVGTLAAGLLVAQVVGRRLGVDPDLRTLIGVGTAVCGASAIAAVSPVIRARSGAVAYAVSTIFAFNVVAVLVFPPLGHLLGLGQHAFGVFAGTAVNDTSSVVAAATSYGRTAGHDAVVVKLTRSLAIIPISLALAAVVRRRDRAAAGPGAAGDPDGPGGPLRAVGRAARLVPWFLVGFVLVAAAGTVHPLSVGGRDAAAQLALVLIVVALAAIGASTDVAALRRAGARPLLLGALAWVAVAVTSLVLQAVV